MTGRDSSLYRRIVENLRSGVPSPRVAGHFPMGREHFLQAASQHLEAAADGTPSGMLVQANYGEGKTHLLHAIWNLAIGERFAVSMVALSTETTLDKLDRLYAKLVANTYVPDSSQPGLDHLLQGYRPGHSRAERLLAWAETELHPKVFAVLRNRIEGESTDALVKLDQDLAGVFIGLQDLKSIHRLNFQQPLKIAPPFKVKRHVFDYFRLMERLIMEAGYRGWVLLLDEVELIGRLGRGGRAGSYANLARLCGHGGPEGWPVLRHVVTVGAVASNFVTEVLQQRDETTVAPAWLRERDRINEADQARKAIQELQRAELLTPLDDEAMRHVMEQIVAAHSAAYAWDPGLSGAELMERTRQLAPTVDVKLRTRIRTAIQWLDLRMQYGGEPSLAIGTPEEEDFAELAGNRTLQDDGHDAAVPLTKNEDSA